MTIRDYLQHFGLNTNPFSDEDAQTDPVFKNACIKTTRHPAWDKLYGDPGFPATAIVFGEKGSGKTALRLQMIRDLTMYNTDHPDNNVFVVDYSDMNPFLDQFRNRQPRRRRISKVLSRLTMDDHLDAILSLAVTQLVDRLLCSTENTGPAAVNSVKPDKLTESQARDLLMLVAVYDRGRENADSVRFSRLADLTMFSNLKKLFYSWRDLSIGLLGTILTLGMFGYFKGFGHFQWLLLCLAIVWLPFIIKIIKRSFKIWSIRRALRTIPFDFRKGLSILMRFTPDELQADYFPKRGSSENRYYLLARFLEILKAEGFCGMLVLIDRVDEPYLINGAPELMKSLVWPLLDNKLLKYDRLGFKFLLPGELYPFMEKESKGFHDRARLDKQNVIADLDWSGEALYDLANIRLNACRADGEKFSITSLFDPSIDRKHLIDAFSKVRVPRHLFKFLYRLFTVHINNISEDDPKWQISPTEFESTLAVYLKERNTAERTGSSLC